VAHPVSIMVETFGTETVDPRQASSDAVREVFDLRPAPSCATSTCAARSTARPRPTATSVATDEDFTWERTDRVDDLKSALGAVARGNALIIVPSIHQSQVVAGRLRRLGVRVALHPRDWALGAGGATVVGGRTAAFAPVADLAAIVMIDEHDEVYQQEQAPTWHAREVLVERAARAGVPIVVTSPIPTPEARAVLPLLEPGRPAERAGWPMVRVVDLRTDDSARGTLWTSALVRAFDVEGRVAVVLNRKGRARLLACAACDSLATCTECGSAMRQGDDPGLLECPNGHHRPVVCDACGATRFKQLRVGVTRAREELETLLREPVAEVTGDAEDLPDGRVLVGTEAVLHRVDGLDAVAFVDFDQELAAPRYRSAEQALALVVRAGRLVGGRRDRTGEVLVQTRQPDHPAIRAAVTADVESWAQGEIARRRILRYPPFAALAHVSGASAEEFIARWESRRASRSGARRRCMAGPRRRPYDPRRCPGRGRTPQGPPPGGHRPAAHLSIRRVRQPAGVAGAR
jgi:primosomal protein N' (replication factor Y) (superfamily II helicase)